MFSSLVRGCGVVRLAFPSLLAPTSTSLLAPTSNSASFSTSMWSSRWWSEHIANKKRKRFGYRDLAKQEGPLPRIKDDSPSIKQVALYKPNNAWSPTNALAGQNDYIDILGSGELHPKQLLYHVPEYLKGAYHKEKHFQVMLRRQRALEHTPFPKAFPSKWQGWQLNMLAEHRWINRHVDQNWWANYRGTKEGPVRNPFKRRLF